MSSASLTRAIQTKRPSNLVQVGASNPAFNNSNSSVTVADVHALIQRQNELLSREVDRLTSRQDAIFKAVEAASSRQQHLAAHIEKVVAQVFVALSDKLDGREVAFRIETLPHDPNAAVEIEVEAGAAETSTMIAPSEAEAEAEADAEPVVPVKKRNRAAKLLKRLRALSGTADASQLTDASEVASEPEPTPNPEAVTAEAVVEVLAPVVEAVMERVHADQAASA
jgi:hypothetical protein